MTINWIVNRLAIGEYSDIEVDRLTREHVTCVLCVRETISREDVDIMVKAKVRIMFCPLKVDPDQNPMEYMRECKIAVMFLNKAMLDGERVLVYCTAGMDRSPFIVALYMSSPFYTLNKLREAYKEIKKKRPVILEHEEWLKFW